jgi:hypothetical protein
MARKRKKTPADSERGGPNPLKAFEDMVADTEDGDDELDLQSVLKAEFEDAADYVDSVIAPIREQAFAYYQGHPFGDEEPGRSQIVLRVTADTVDAIMPSLMRVFVGGEEVVQFEPNAVEDIAAAEQATDYINWATEADGNNRFTLFYSWFKDALVKKVGFVGWEWCDDKKIIEQSYTDLSPGQVKVLAADPDVKITKQRVKVERDPEVEALLQDPNLLPAQQLEIAAHLEVTIDVTIKRTRKKGFLKFYPIPPEEVVISRHAKSEDDATLFGRRRYVKASDLAAMGVPEDAIERGRGGRDGTFGANSEALLRQLNPDFKSPSSGDESQNDVFLFEGWMRVDTDDDDIAELRFIRAIGEGFEIVHDEPEPCVRIAALSPIIEPHTIWGTSMADKTMDLQNVSSHVMRGTLDSLASSIFPTLGVVEGAVELEDALNTEMGRIIRMKAPGMVQPFSEPFIGPQALQVLDYLDKIKAKRTGQSDASQGLDPDVLQSTTKAAVTATISGAEEAKELIARTFAETGVKRLFRGALQTIIRHQDRPRVIRLRGKFVEMDPRDWDADMDVKANVALGRGDDLQKMGFLAQIKQTQEAILMQLGPGNPLVGFDHYYATLAEMCRIAGYKDASRFFRPIDATQAQAFAQQAAQSKGASDPAQAMVQIEQTKAQAKMQTDQMKAQVDVWTAKQEDDRERDKLDAEIELKRAELQGKFAMDINQQQLDARMAADRDAMQIAAQERMGVHKNQVQGQMGMQRNAMQAQARPAPNQRPQ